MHKSLESFLSTTDDDDDDGGDDDTFDNNFSLVWVCCLPVCTM